MEERAILEYLDSLTEQAEKSLPACRDGELLKEEMKNGLAMARAATRTRAFCYGLERGTGLEAEIEALCKKHRELWPKRNKTDGLEDSLRGFTSLLAQIKEKTETTES